MLAKKHRLAKTKDVKRSLAQGRGFFSPFFTLKFFKTQTQPRFTVVVSVKVSKKAVKRNRLKRIVREFLRLRLQRFVLGDYVIIIKPKAATQEEKNLLRVLEELLVVNKLLT